MTVQTLRAQTPALPGVPRRMRALCALAVGILFAGPASAVFTFIPLNTARTITLQVGSADGTVNNVTFNVTGNNTSPTPQPVVGIPSAGTPATTPAGGVRIRMRATWPSGNAGVRLTVNSAAGLACVGGTGCGVTVIPFNTIRWDAFEKGNYSTVDIQSAAFNGGASQTLSAFSCCGSGGIEMANTLVFTYNNATLYPAGRYTGRVVYTATIL